jgi:hypothetical protein
MNTYTNIRTYVHTLHTQTYMHAHHIREKDMQYANTHTQMYTHIRFASALSILGTQNEKQVRAMGITVLPDGLFGKVLQVIFTPPEAVIKLCIVTNSGQDMRITAALVGENLVTFRPAHLTLEDLSTINMVRRIVSDAISGRSSMYSAAAAVTPATVQRLMQVPTHVQF